MLKRVVRRKDKTADPAPIGVALIIAMCVAAHRNIQHTVRYTALAPDRFRNFWRD
jgi:hypothetical protein